MCFKTICSANSKRKEHPIALWVFVLPYFTGKTRCYPGFRVKILTDVATDVHPCTGNVYGAVSSAAQSTSFARKNVLCSAAEYFISCIFRAAIDQTRSNSTGSGEHFSHPAFTAIRFLTARRVVFRQTCCKGLFRGHSDSCYSCASHLYGHLYGFIYARLSSVLSEHRLRSNMRTELSKHQDRAWHGSLWQHHKGTANSNAPESRFVTVTAIFFHG